MNAPSVAEPAISSTAPVADAVRRKSAEYVRLPGVEQAMPFRIAQRVAPQRGQGDDRAIVIVSPERTIIGVFDGAGGTTNGSLAAEAMCKALEERAGDCALDAVALLREGDLALAREGSGGETTAVVLIVDDNGVVGASVGDSGAWVVTPTSHLDLTQGQVRKPLVGTGGAVPIPFATGPIAGTLLVATDGLLKYGNPARIGRIATSTDLDSIPDQLVASVRSRSGELQDDVAVVVCRPEAIPSS